MNPAALRHLVQRQNAHVHSWSCRHAAVCLHALTWFMLHFSARSEVKKLQEQQLKPKEQVTLEPYERDHAVVVGVYRPPPKKKE
jgi:hypothetical protein